MQLTKLILEKSGEYERDGIHNSNLCLTLFNALIVTVLLLILRGTSFAGDLGEHQFASAKERELAFSVHLGCDVQECAEDNKKITDSPEFKQLVDYIECWRIVDLLVDIPKGFKEFDFDTHPNTNPFPTAVSNVAGSDRLKLLRLRRNIQPLLYSFEAIPANSKIAGLSYPAVPPAKSVAKLGYIDSVIPLYLAADDTVENCKNRGCQIWAYVDPQNTTTHNRQYGPTEVLQFGPISIDHMSYVRAVFPNIYLPGDQDNGAGYFFSAVSNSVKTGEIYGTEQKLNVELRHLQSECKRDYNGYSYQCGKVATIIRQGRPTPSAQEIIAQTHGAQLNGFWADEVAFIEGSILSYRGWVSRLTDEQKQEKCYNRASLN